MFHTNTIENFFSIMKRGIVGVYHHVSEAHLGRYLDEFTFRYNNRIGNGVDDAERFSAHLETLTRSTHVVSLDDVLTAQNERRTP